jgi:hypothetical protein
MRPQLQPRDTVGACQTENDVTATIGSAAQTGRCDTGKRKIEGKREHDADAHHHTPVGQRVDGRACRQPGEQSNRRQRRASKQRGPQQRRERRRQIATISDDETAPQSEQHAEIQQQLAQVKGAQGQSLRVGRTLPEDPLAGRQALRKSVLGLEFMLVPMAWDVHAGTVQRRGSLRLGSAYSVPPP